MKRIIIALTLIVASTGAGADIWSPQGTSGLANIGSFNVTASLPLSCNLSGSIIIDATGDASLGSLSITPRGSAVCGLVMFNNLPYTIVGNADNTVTLKDTDFYVLGDGHCIGDLTGDFNQSTGEITFNAAVVPNVGFVRDCKITGTISTNPQVSFVP
ncbi:hypothetical protein ACJJI4_21370 [Microbulbifer sp. TRSA002]|uniref:hypothetical protein n=1 Tax=Microbulbifer sp. TRSA002 TaxID=3243382 RepID=UPI004039CB7A